jgi:hypothetical protein
MKTLVRVLLLGASLTAFMYAAPGNGKGHGYGREHDAPEINGDSAASALALVTGVLLMYRARLKR